MLLCHSWEMGYVSVRSTVLAMGFDPLHVHRAVTHMQRREYAPSVEQLLDILQRDQAPSSAMSSHQVIVSSFLM